MGSPALPYQVSYAIDPPWRHTRLYRPVRERRGSQGCSCTPGWPGQATGGRRLRAGGDQLPDGPGRLCRGPPAHRGRHRDRVAGVRPRHGGRRGTQWFGRNGRNVRRDADGFAAAARDRGPFSIPGDTW